MDRAWIVHKFGGTSVANPDRYRDVARLVVSDKSPQKAIIVSAMSGVTNQLIDLTQSATQRKDGYVEQIDSLKKRHLETLNQLVPKGDSGLTATLETDFSHLKEMLRGIWLARSCSNEMVELISGYGEQWSAQFLNAHLKSLGVDSCWLDARQILTVRPEPLRAMVDWEVSQSKIDQWLKANRYDTVVVTGFIASTKEGIPTTLKRNGSDFSASIFGSLLKASIITIWTDVDGVYTADPRLVPEAVVLNELSYNEATELAYFGAKVVHPSTMAPAIKDGIPIWIKNTFSPEKKGTKIHDNPSSDRPVAGFATIDGMALINLEGTGMIGVPGVAERLFGALKEVGVSVVMISQASSEHSICFAIPEGQADLAKNTVEKTFYGELRQAQLQTVSVTPRCTILAIVGDNMAQKPGVAGRFLGALGNAGVNVRAIAQGSSERNISVVIDGIHSTKGVRAAHAAFYLSPQTLSIGVIGCGLIGGTFLDQLRDQIGNLKSGSNIDLRVRAVMNSRKMKLEEHQLDLKEWRKSLETATESAQLEKFISHLETDHIPHTVVIDCTANETVPSHYPEWIKRGIHIITPNKKGNGGPLSLYREIESACHSTGRHFLYQTTVGAGLPLLRTLRDLVKTGDKILQVEGILSGTLSFLLNSFDGSEPFSQIVLKAKSLGYTEPDPREDLSGMDFARKIVILAREMGLSMELEDLFVQNLVAEPLRKISLDGFLKRLPEADAEMDRLLKESRAKHEVLRYVGTIQPTGKSSVQLKSFPLTHPFVGLSGTDNIVAFTTARYQTQPLIVRGPGAGPHVTAGGVFADLLRLVSYLGGPA